MADEKTPEKAKVETKTKSKTMSFLKKVVIGFVVFIVAVIALAFFFTRGAAKAGNDIISDLQAGNCDSVYEMTSEGFQGNTDADTWDAACQQIYPILQGDAEQRSVNVDAETGQTSTAEVVYRIEGTDGITYDVSLLLVDEDGWKLEGLDSRDAEQPSDDTDATPTTTDQTETE